MKLYNFALLFFKNHVLTPCERVMLRSGSKSNLLFNFLFLHNTYYHQKSFCFFHYFGHSIWNSVWPLLCTQQVFIEKQFLLHTIPYNGVLLCTPSLSHIRRPHVGKRVTTLHHRYWHNYKLGLDLVGFLFVQTNENDGENINED